MHMRILVDADACPVVDIIEELGQKYNKEIILFYDTSHITNRVSKIIYVDCQSDSVDYEIVCNIKKGDLVVTQDYGLASMSLAKGALVINQNGFMYDEFNILSLLSVRALKQKLRKNHKNHLKGPKKRTKDDDLKFYNLLTEILINDQ